MDRNLSFFNRRLALDIHCSRFQLHGALPPPAKYMVTVIFSKISRKREKELIEKINNFNSSHLRFALTLRLGQYFRIKKRPIVELRVIENME